MGQVWMHLVTIDENEKCSNYVRAVNIVMIMMIMIRDGNDGPVRPSF